MKNNNLKLIYTALGALMLILLQSDIFQNAIAFIHLIQIPYFMEIIFLLINISSFIGAIIFVIVAFKLIINNIRNKQV